MKITFPHLGNVYIACKGFLEELGHEVVTPPICSRKTLEIGSKYSPEMMCMPFKIFIGNYIESIEKGADTILITGSCGPCRFGLYPIIQADILKRLGYDVDIIVFDAIGEGIDKLRTNVNKILNSKSSQEIYRSSKLALSLIRKTDDLSQLSNEVRAYALNKIDVDKIMNNYYLNIEQTHGAEELLKLIKNTEIDLREVPIDKNINPLKIGIIGEIYTIIEPFANLEIEKKLGDLNVLVEKSLTPTIWLEHHVLSYPFGSKHENMKHKLAEQYLKNPVGGHGRETVGSAIYYKSRGFDGVIQILPLNCMPEIVAKSILKTVEKDEDFPIMTLVVDEMTGEAGYLTRLEAFIDLINKRREKCIG